MHLQPAPADQSREQRIRTRLKRWTARGRRRLWLACIVVLLVTLPINVVGLFYPDGLHGFLFRPPTPGERAAERASSMQRVAGALIAEESIESYFRKRCGVLVSTPRGEGVIRIDRQDSLAHDGVRTLTLSRDEAQKLFRSGLNVEFKGTCAQVTSDGYFLTAAHCLEDDRDLHVISSTTTGNTFRKARIVHTWPEPVDLAVLKIDDAGPDCFPLSGRPAVIIGGIIVSAGLRLGESGETLQLDLAVTTDLAAGQILKFEPVPNQVTFHEVTTDLPLVPGNSGGPMSDLSGRLVGITTRGEKLPWPLVRGLFPREPLAFGTAVEPTALEAIIREDRGHHASPAPSITGGSTTR